MYKMNSRLFLLVFLLGGMISTAQVKTDLRPYVNAHCPNAVIREVELRLNLIEIDFTCDERLYELILNSKFETISLEYEIEANELPSKLQKRLSKKFAQHTIDDVAQIEVRGEQFFKVELIQNGFEEVHYFCADGRPMKNLEIPGSRTFSATEIAAKIDLKKLGYNPLKPTDEYEMPSILTELSGISVEPDGTIWCIQDEIGAAFRFNPITSSLNETLRFTDVGDFEDIVTFGDSLWVLRSDGAIFSMNIKQFEGSTKRYQHRVQSLNIEGMTYDQHNNRVLLAAKEPDVNEPENSKTVYALDLQTSDPISKLFKIDVAEIETMLKKAMAYATIPPIDFQPSAIGVQPITSDIYILSATDRMLAVYTPNYQLKTVCPLPASIYYKPEGLSFSANGNLFIAGEGTKDGTISATILEFQYSKE
jgi:hypothetical protein